VLLLFQGWAARPRDFSSCSDAFEFFFPELVCGSALLVKRPNRRQPSEAAIFVKSFQISTWPMRAQLVPMVRFRTMHPLLTPSIPMAYFISSFHVLVLFQHYFHLILTSAVLTLTLFFRARLPIACGKPKTVIPSAVFA
jgi:hypothetical protein